MSEKLRSPILQTLAMRGLLKDCSRIEELDSFLATGQKISVYAGFDPTADSLHVGHLATLTVLKIFAEAGHEILPLVGTGTALIGDPTGRTTSRPLLGHQSIDTNAQGVEESIRRVLKDNKLRVLRNGDWIGDASLVGFLREIGSRISLSHLLAQDSVKSRLGDTGISFLEACYPLLQAWDFWKLSQGRDVLLQVGGSDQWGNICMGLELIGRVDGDDKKAFGMTHPLLTNANGQKMGKTSGGAIWLNSDKLDDYNFFRFWRTLPDADTSKIARMLSGIDMNTILNAESEGGISLDGLKASLAFSMTESVRGTNAAIVSKKASEGRGATADGLRTIEGTEDDLSDLPGLMVKAGLVTSKSAARRLASQGGLRINGEQRLEMLLNMDDIKNDVVVLSAGKTLHCAIRFDLENIYEAGRRMK